MDSEEESINRESRKGEAWCFCKWGKANGTGKMIFCILQSAGAAFKMRRECGRKKDEVAGNMGIGTNKINF